MAELVASRTPLEVCPSSNVRLGVAPDLESHPIGELHSSGVALTINTDDPGFFETSLCDEYLRVAETLGLGADEIARIAYRAFEQAFLPPADRPGFEARFRSGLVEASQACLGRTIELDGLVE